VASSNVDRSELSGVILKQQFQFSLRLMRIEVELILFSLGYSGIDTTGLTESLDALRQQLQGMAAVVEPMAA